MGAEQKALIEELIEHTKDCDCARSQHFYEERKLKLYGKIFNIAQDVFFLATIATYVLIYVGIHSWKYINILGIILTVVSTLLQLLSYMLKFDEEAMAHWKSAQIYSELYRKCQFFYTHHYQLSLAVWRAELEEISEELSRISLLSPGVSKRSYIEWEKTGGKKQYSIYKMIKDLKSEEITDIINDIVHEFKNDKIKVFVFGSYLYKSNYNDIDIAVILYEKEKTLQEKEILCRLERDYLKRGIKLDITLLSHMDIKSNKCSEFVKNIFAGECYYESSGIFENDTEETATTLKTYSRRFLYFKERAEKNISDYMTFIMNSFYAYYYILAFWAYSAGITWNGEDSLISKSNSIIDNIDKAKLGTVKMDDFLKLIEHVRVFKKEKDIAYLNIPCASEEFESLKEYFQADMKVAEQSLMIWNKM